MKLGPMLCGNRSNEIGSALEYRHKNIVHRCLGIENILVPRTRDIKVTDFGPTPNVYYPLGHLATACGSSYSLAPEPPDARVYASSRVDTWGFGIVL